MELKVGTQFSTYDDLLMFIKSYELENKQKYWKRSSRTIGCSRLTKSFNQNIRYYEIHYSCIHGGQKFKTKSRGLRTVRTVRMNCPANIKIRASADGQCLEIKSYIDKHENHIESVVESEMEEETMIADAESEMDETIADATEVIEEKKYWKKTKAVKRKHEKEDVNIFKDELDDSDSFGHYVAMELRGLRSDYNRRRLKSEIRKSIVRIVDEDDLYTAASTSAANVFMESNFANHKS